jgi:hypothetical protein
MVESSFLDEDPVLFESASAYHRARISRARDPLFDAMQSLLAARPEACRCPCSPVRNDVSRLHELLDIAVVAPLVC